MHAARTLGLLLLALACTLVPATAVSGTGTVRGKVAAPAADEFTEEMLRDRSLTRYEMHLHASNEPVLPYQLSEKAVIYLEAVPAVAGTFDPPDVHPRLNQSQMLFRPLVLAVLAGTTVDFPNNDNLFHNVFSYSQPREFDLGRYPKGQMWSVRFDRPGVVSVYCDIHAYMYATILVLENPYFASPDNDGSYVIDNVPAGTYRIVYWYGRKRLSSKQITIEDSKTTVVNFGY